MNQRNNNLNQLRYGPRAKIVEDQGTRKSRNSELDKLLGNEERHPKMGAMGADSVYPEKDVQIVKNLINKCADLIEVMNSSTRAIFLEEISRLKEVLE